jgi:glycosyltransferase involved in cell wall biosynthesis
MARSPRKPVPKLSIGLPVYNAEQLLPQALDHLLAQTFEDFELVICDNASTDRTSQICRDYARRDARIRYVRNDRNLGANPNYNRTYELSAAPLFKWAAHDDLYERTYLENCVRILDRDPTVVLAHSGTMFIGDDGQAFAFDSDTGTYVDPETGARHMPDSYTIGDSAAAVERFRQVLFQARWGSHMYGVVRREALAQTQLLLNFASSDRTMLAELALLGRFRSVPERLYLRRVHAGSSWALGYREIKSYLSTDGQAYSRRARQIRAFFGAPADKPVGIMTKAMCTALVGGLCARAATDALTGHDVRKGTPDPAWRRKSTNRAQVTSATDRAGSALSEGRF